MAHVVTDESPARSYCVDKWESSVVEVRCREVVAHSPFESYVDGIVDYVQTRLREKRAKAASEVEDPLV